MMYASFAAKLNSPVAGFTEPPPSDFAYKPNFVFLIISSGVDVPGRIKVFDFLVVGSYF